MTRTALLRNCLNHHQRIPIPDSCSIHPFIGRHECGPDDNETGTPSTPDTVHLRGNQSAAADSEHYELPDKSTGSMRNVAQQSIGGRSCDALENVASRAGHRNSQETCTTNKQQQ